MQATINIETVLAAYVECALWSSSDQSDDQGGTPLDQLDAELAPETLEAMRADVVAFLADDSITAALEYWSTELGDAQIGHNFWLTRNGHGAGFWDRFSAGLGEVDGRTLTAAAKAYGDFNLYVGDDGLIYGT